MNATLPATICRQLAAISGSAAAVATASSTAIANDGAAAIDAAQAVVNEIVEYDVKEILARKVTQPLNQIPHLFPTIYNPMFTC